MPVRRERIDLVDGDFVDLDWVEPPGPADDSRPLLLVLHGLEGSSRSAYVQGLLRLALDRGWRGVALNFRSCSGPLNRATRFYHSGDTGDLDALVRLLAEREPTLRVGAVGVSLGGNVLLKWVGECRADVPKQMVAAVGISVPFDLVACQRVLSRGFRRAVYTENFLRTMREKVRLKAAVYPGFVDLDAALRARTFAEYDRVVTAPLHGFADEMDYWVSSSSGPHVPRILCPTLLINALDDPIVPLDALPDPSTLPPWIQADFPSHGGHAGFIDRPWSPTTGSWAERRAIEFLAPHVETSDTDR